ncbi:MAG: IS1 family transposase [Bacteroidia bacterium]
MNEVFLKKLPDSQERESLKRLDCQVFISAEADEQWSFIGSKKTQRWL